MIDIFTLIYKSWQYGILPNALLAGTFIAIASSLIGIFLVLKRLSLISDGLSHVSFTTLIIALLIGISPLLISIPLVILASFGINKLSEKAHIYSDSAIGLISSFSIAIGIIIVSVSSGFNIDINSYLFGSISTINSFEVILSALISISVIVFLFLFFNDLFLMIFDENYAKVSKININLINFIFTIAQSLTIVIGVKIVGALLMSSLIVFPAASSLQIAKRFRSMIIYSSAFAVSSVIIGIILSSVIKAPPGAFIVCINGLIFIIVFTANKIFKIK